MLFLLRRTRNSGKKIHSQKEWKAVDEKGGKLKVKMNINALVDTLESIAIDFSFDWVSRRLACIKYEVIEAKIHTL